MSKMRSKGRYYRAGGRRRRERVLLLTLALGVLCGGVYVLMRCFPLRGLSAGKPSDAPPSQGNTLDHQNGGPVKAELPISEVPLPLEETGQSGLYDYARPVPEGPAVDDAYFSDAAFIGNSLTEGFKLYSGLKTADYFTYRGITVTTIDSKKCIPLADGGEQTILEALGQKQYRKIYIMLGLNELGYSNHQGFYDSYAKLIDQIKEMQPDAIIYVQSVLPVTRERSENDVTFNNEKVGIFNEMLVKLAEEKQVYYVDIGSSLQDLDGALPAEAASDGIHLNKSYCVKWLDYLKTHTIKIEK